MLFKLKNPSSLPAETSFQDKYLKAEEKLFQSQGLALNGIFCLPVKKLKPTESVSGKRRQGIKINQEIYVLTFDLWGCYAIRW